MTPYDRGEQHRSDRRPFRKRDDRNGRDHTGHGPRREGNRDRGHGNFPRGQRRDDRQRYGNGHDRGRGDHVREHRRPDVPARPKIIIPEDPQKILFKGIDLLWKRVT